MEGLIHLAIKVSRLRVTLAYRLLVAAPARWQTNLILYYDKEYTRYGVARYGVVWYTFIRCFVLHRTVTMQRYSQPNDNLGQREVRTRPRTSQAGYPRPTGPGPFRLGSAPSRSLMLFGQLLTCSLLHVGAWRRLLHGLDRAPCHSSFNIFDSGSWSFTDSCFAPGPFGVMFMMCLDLCRASWSSLEVLDELFPKVSL
jgi:hypothetical protein